MDICASGVRQNPADPPNGEYQASGNRTHERVGYNAPLYHESPSSPVARGISLVPLSASHQIPAAHAHRTTTEDRSQLGDVAACDERIYYVRYPVSLVHRASIAVGADSEPEPCRE